MGTPIPRNRARFTLAEITEVTGGVLSPQPHALPDLAVSSICTDTRALDPGAAFVALKGESFDGHALLEAAARAGAVVAVVERDVTPPPGLSLVHVDSTLRALGALGRAYAQHWRSCDSERKTIAITGSAGKTTTRIAITALLEALFPGQVLVASGNLNNRIGVPMVLLGLQERHRFAILELGTNRPGEIAQLASITAPDLAIVTLIAAAHCEGLGSVEAVATEKGALFASLRKDGIAMGNGDDARVRHAIAKSPARTRVLYGVGPDSNYRITRRTPKGLVRASLRIERPVSRSTPLEVTTPLLGEAGALACAAAIASVEALLGIALDGSQVTDALARADIGAGAGRLLPRILRDGSAVIDDSYNANPASTTASIRAASEIASSTGRRLILVLGEMRELGVESAAGHDEVGRAAAASGAAEVIAVMGEASRIAERVREAGGKATFVRSASEAATAAIHIVRATDLILVKGSRGVATEKVVHALADAHGGIAEEMTRAECPNAEAGP